MSIPEHQAALLRALQKDVGKAVELRYSGQWPITAGRIRDHLRKWRHRRHDQKPFTVQCLEYVLDICDVKGIEIGPPEPALSPAIRAAITDPVTRRPMFEELVEMTNAGWLLPDELERFRRLRLVAKSSGVTITPRDMYDLITLYQESKGRNHASRTESK